LLAANVDVLLLLSEMSIETVDAIGVCGVEWTSDSVESVVSIVGLRDKTALNDE